MRILLMVVGELVPVGVLIAAVLYERWRRKQAGERPPQSEKLLRQAGHTLREQLDDRQDTLSMWFTLAMVGGLLFGMMLWLGVPGYVGGCVGGALMAVTGTVMGWRTLIVFRRLRLGLMGEQAVAEHLQPLLAEGYRVFNDVPGSGAWNIDHVVVGSAGVFAIETKTRTKKPGRYGEKDHEVSFDGRTLAFPWGNDTDSPAQARRNAEWLARELTKATGEKVGARPLLILPGWFVTLKANSELKVLNAKQAPGYVLSEPRTLDNSASTRIAYQLDQRCRDVEF